MRRTHPFLGHTPARENAVRDTKRRPPDNSGLKSNHGRCYISLQPRSEVQIEHVMTQKWPRGARWVAACPRNAPVDSVAPANGMSPESQRRRPPAEGRPLGDLKSCRHLGGRGTGGLKLVVGTTPHCGRRRHGLLLEDQTVDPNQRNRRGKKERPLLSVGRGLVTAMEDARRGVTQASSAPRTRESMARELQYALRLRSALKRPMPRFVFLACFARSMLRDHRTHAKARNESDA